MKICLLSNDYVQQFPTFSYGGVEICVESLANQLHESGLDFFVIVPKRSAKKEYPFKIIETEASPSSESGKDSTHFAYSAKKIIKQENPDVIWSQSNWSADCLHDLKIPIICTFHDSRAKEFGWIKRYPNVRYRFLSNFSYNNWVTEDWEKKISFVLHSGIQQEDYNFNPKEKTKGYWLWVSGLRWGKQAKGLDVAMAMAEKMPLKEFRIYGAGNEALEKECIEFSKKYPNFNYLGELKRGEDHDKAFSEAEAFLMPTRIPDTFPRVVLEAISKGTPVIGSNFGSIPEMVGDCGGIIMNNDLDLMEISNKIFNLDRKNVYESSFRYSAERELKGLMERSNF